MIEEETIKSEKSFSLQINEEEVKESLNDQEFKNDLQIDNKSE